MTLENKLLLSTWLTSLFLIVLIIILGVSAKEGLAVTNDGTIITLHSYTALKKPNNWKEYPHEWVNLSFAFIVIGFLSLLLDLQGITRVYGFIFFILFNYLAILILWLKINKKQFYIDDKPVTIEFSKLYYMYIAFLFAISISGFFYLNFKKL